MAAQQTEKQEPQKQENMEQRKEQQQDKSCLLYTSGLFPLSRHRQKLMERLDRQDELLLAMKAEGKQPTITESIRLVDNQDLCMLLQISKRTLQRDVYKRQTY